MNISVKPIGVKNVRISNVVYVSRRRRFPSRIFPVLLVIVIAVVLLILAISAFNALNLTHPSRTPIDSNPAAGSDYKDIQFRNDILDYELKGWFFPSKQNKANIILVHGYGLNRLQFGKNTFTLIGSLQDAGYNVLAFDLRYSGQSEGDYVSLGYYEKVDIISAVQWLNKEHPGKTALLGYSTGATAVILAAAESKDISALVVDTPFSDLRSFMNRHLSKWSSLPSFPFSRTIVFFMEVFCRMDASKISPANMLYSIKPKPVLFIHSQNDSSIPLEDNSDMYDSYLKLSDGASETWITGSGGHAGSYNADPAVYTKKIIEFFDKQLDT